jgi:hypothetical protein
VRRGVGDGAAHDLARSEIPAHRVDRDAHQRRRLSAGLRPARLTR